MSIKVLVALNGAFLPLQTHLSQLPANAHSERLRSLASMGLLIQSGRLQASVAAGHVELPGKDEGALNYLRFPVVLNEAYPDLHAEMERTPVRLRAERLRALATLGLHAVAMAAEAKSGAPALTSEPVVQVAPVVPIAKETIAQPIIQATSQVEAEHQKPAVLPEQSSSEVPEAMAQKSGTPMPEQEELKPNAEPIRPKKNSRVSSFAKSLGI